MLTKLKKEDVLGQPVEKVLLASGLVASKSGCSRQFPDFRSPC